MSPPLSSAKEASLVSVIPIPWSAREQFVSSSTNHYHWSITFIPVTPEADLLSALDVSTALSLLKPVCWLVLSAMLNRTTTQRLIVGPDRAIFKVAISCYFRSECLSTQTVTCGLQQRGVARVVTTRDLKFASSDQPKGRWYHISVNWWVICLSSGSLLVIPPSTIATHPTLAIAVWESSDKSPSFKTCCDITIGSFVVPMAACWSYHHLPSLRIQFSPSLFENRAMRVHTLRLAVISQLT